MQLGPRERRGVDRHLVGARVEHRVRVLRPARTPPPIVNGTNTSSAARRASSTTVARLSDVAVMSRKTSSSAPWAS